MARVNVILDTVHRKALDVMKYDIDILELNILVH